MSHSPSNTTEPESSERSHLLDALKQKIQHCETLHHAGVSQSQVVSSGCSDLDSLLPRGGFRADGLVEWLSGQVGCGTGLWALHVASLALAMQDSRSGQTTQAIVVIDQDRTFYPPAAAGIGLDLQRLVIVQPRSSSDTIWAVDQALRCPAIAAVWANLPRLDPRDFRRFQLAAEEGRTLGLLLRPLTARGKPSWSDVQLQVTPQVLSHPSATVTSQCEQRLLQVQLLRCRGGRSDGSLHIEMASSTGLSRNIQLRAVAPLDSFSDPSTSDGQELRQDDKESFTHSKDRLPPTLFPTETSHHETSAVYLAAQLARPTLARRSARA
jgi:hypothetical protein